MISDCCGAVVRFQDICSRCGEHCGEVFEMDGVECGHEDCFEDSDDGYDAARDAYLTGDGPAFTRSQIEEDRAWAEECRRNRW